MTSLKMQEVHSPGGCYSLGVTHYRRTTFRAARASISRCCSRARPTCAACRAPMCTAWGCPLWRAFEPRSRTWGPHPAPPLPPAKMCDTQGTLAKDCQVLAKTVKPGAPVARTILRHEPCKRLALHHLHHKQSLSYGVAQITAVWHNMREEVCIHISCVSHHKLPARFVCWM